jgi:hypothetical protein
MVANPAKAAWMHLGRKPHETPIIMIEGVKVAHADSYDTRKPLQQVSVLPLMHCGWVVGRALLTQLPDGRFTSSSSTHSLFMRPMLARTGWRALLR